MLPSEPDVAWFFAIVHRPTSCAWCAAIGSWIHDHMNPGEILREESVTFPGYKLHSGSAHRT